MNPELRAHRSTSAAALLIAATMSVVAQPTVSVWNPGANPAGSGKWNEGANWTAGMVPDGSTKAVFNVADAISCMVTNSAVAGQVVGGDNGPGGTLVIAQGGSLNAGALDWCAVGYNNTHLLVVESGGVVSFGNHLWVGFDPGADGVLALNGGTVSVAGMFGLGWNGGKGTAQINAGTLNLSQWHPTDSIKGASVLDISGGQVVIEGDQRASLSNYVVSGKITAYGGLGTLTNFYESGMNKTTLSAAPGSDASTNMSSSLSIKLFGTNVVVSWPVSAVRYTLQCATNLAAVPIIWATLTNSPATNNGIISVRLNQPNVSTLYRLSPAVDISSLNHKLMMGYQGWFACPGDGSAVNRWVHWFGNNTPTAANANFDFWPDTSELDPDELFPTTLTYSNGSPATLYSAYKPKTVLRHFKWMQENHLDGVFFQRFLTDLPGGSFSALRNQVAVNVQAGAETYGRAFAVMYDISGYPTNALMSKLTNDWLYLVNTQHVTNSPAYLHHKGKPVVAIWGFGFSGRSDTPEQAQQTITWFKSAGCTVMGGVPSNWRTLTGDAQTNPSWSNAFRSFDIISPWSVGRYGNNTGADSYRTSVTVPDLADCTNHGIDYLPVIFPGFSWSNLNSGPLNQIPRNGGNFYWRQAYNAVRSGCTMIYGAMFDEVDEGTAMYKLAPTAAQLPVQSAFVPLNIDGYNLSSDWYLRLADQAGRMLRGEIPPTGSIPIAPP